MARYWPFALGGMLGPILARALAIWVPSYSAAAGSYFVVFFASFWLYERLGATGHHRLAGNLIASAAGGAVVGLLTYLFPSK